MTQRERERLLAVLLRLERGEDGATVGQAITLVYRLAGATRARSSGQIKGRANRALKALDRLDRARAGL